MCEVWVDIIEYEGLYQVSNLGRVRSLDRPSKKGRILKQNKGSSGYLHISLWKHGKGYIINTHRLVALTFIQNKLNLPQVNHKDLNKHNNNVENLEWITNKNNGIHAARKMKIGSSVSQFTKENKFVETYFSQMEAERITGISQSSIAHNIRGKSKSAGGYIWKLN